MCGCRTLEVLQDQVEPGPVEDVAEVLQRELGAPASQLFADFEPEARAAASLAQVLPPMHAYISTRLCVHHTATCNLMLVPAYWYAHHIVTCSPALPAEYTSTGHTCTVNELSAFTRSISWLVTGRSKMIWEY